MNWKCLGVDRGIVLAMVRCVLTVGLLWTCAVGNAQQDRTDAADARMQTMRSLAEDIKITQKIDGEQKELPIRDQPLTHYDDPARRFEDGTLWGFGKTNERPQALVTCYTKNAREGKWIHAITSLSEHPLKARFQGRSVWFPNQSDLEFQDFPIEEKVNVENERLRSVQMRNLSRRFTAHQFWDPNNQRLELRLQTTTVVRYSDENRGVLDGGLFLFTRNINPELCLLIEAVEQGDAMVWKFGVVKIGSAEFHVELDGDEVWESPRARGVIGRPQDSYAMFFSSRRLKPASKKKAPSE